MVTLILLGLTNQLQKLRTIPVLYEQCIKVMNEQFGDGLLRLEYPNLDTRIDGQSQQALNHPKINPRVYQTLENALRLRREESIPDLVDSFKGICLHPCGSVLLECVLTKEKF